MIQKLKPFTAEIHVEHILARFGGLRVKDSGFLNRRDRPPNAWPAKRLRHQRKGTTANRRKANEINNSQKIVHGPAYTEPSLVSRNVNRDPDTLD